MQRRKLPALSTNAEHTDVLSVSDRDPEKEEHEVQEGQSLSSLAATDAAMADEDANEAVSVHSSSSESPTIPSTEQPEENDAHMEDDDSANTSSAEEEGDCLSNRPALPDACPAQDEMLEAEDDARSELPPQDVDPPQVAAPHRTPLSLQSNEDRAKASAGRAQSKKLRKSLAPTSRQPLGSIPEHEQPPATLADLANRNAQRQEAPVCRNPETPPDHPGSAQERPHAMTEIDIASDQEHAERGGTAATDLQLESEQRAMQALYDYQNAARTARETDRQRVPLPSLQIYSDLPREWPMARLAISNKQINRLVRTFLWRRVTEQALHGSSFVDIPDEINQAYIGDLLRISEAFAAPLSNLFAFVKNSSPFMQAPASGSMVSLLSSQGAVPLIINTDTRVQKQPKQWKGNHRQQRKKMSMPSPLRALSSCPLLGEWSMVSRRYPPMTSLSIYQYRSCLTWL